MSKRKPRVPTQARYDAAEAGHTAMLKEIAAAKAAYVGFVRECGYEKDARVVDFEKLSSKQQERWKNVARDVLAAYK